MKHSFSLALLILGPSLVLADKTSDGTTVELPEPAETRKEPLTLLEKNKNAELAKGGKSSGPKPGIDVRVVGGTKVTQESKYPFFVQWEDAYCGGSLIYEDVVLSAAHCENKNHPFNSRVFVNGLESGQGVFRTVTQQVAHPMYKEVENNDYDFLLLKLDSSALKDENGADTGCETVTLNTDRSVPETGDPLMAVGFGLTQEGGSATSEFLNDVEVQYVDDANCRSQYGDTFVSDLMFCAGVQGGGKDTCQGDSGGPIILPDSQVQVGVVSFGIGCARADYNGVYARVSAVTEWIEEQICVLSDNPPEGCPPKEENGNDSIGSGNGRIKISVKYDNYANEFGFSLVHDESGQRLFFHPFSYSEARNKASKTWTWDNLPAGDYSVDVGDQGGDGFCCSYGNGELIVTDNKNNQQKWKVTEFGDFLQGKFTVAENGDLTFNGQTTDYENSWEASATPANYPQVNDQSWPGPKPTEKGTLNINIKMDGYPGEVTYSLKKLNNGGNGWTEVDSFDGSEDGVQNDLNSFQLNNLEEGWYELEVGDSGNDGICCQYRHGWVAATGYLKATRRSGLVWGSNGEYGAGVTVYLQVDSSGYFTQVTESSPV